MDNKPVYILCPRCELNYIEESEEQLTQEEQDGLLADIAAENARNGFK